MTRVLMFAKDATSFVPSKLKVSSASSLTTGAEALENNIAYGDDTIGKAIISFQTGLPTPPFLQDIDLELKAELTSDTQEPMLGVASPGPRGTLAELPWEIKEMILRGLDRDRLLSDRQFQAIMNYGATRWETTRQPWDRWGEIREMILENMRCYYYEPCH
ncbi:hypothetical protein BGZ65_011885 [Modicella reniformis]|uniref:Uncharacterized protein n=1 Tax=Modicella reniformis TaxID=1440133 RepID=A0A9P6MJM2_9FUNG|nr:hypothetical protein BGZ65_011885 [Modicella reniformis]